MVTTRSGQKPKENIKLKLWRNPEMKSKSGLTKKDVLRIRLPDGGFRYVWKSRHEHGKRVMKIPKVKKAMEKQRFPKKK